MASACGWRGTSTKRWTASSRATRPTWCTRQAEALSPSPAGQQHAVPQRTALGSLLRGTCGHTHLGERPEQQTAGKSNRNWQVCHSPAGPRRLFAAAGPSHAGPAGAQRGRLRQRGGAVPQRQGGQPPLPGRRLGRARRRAGERSARPGQRACVRAALQGTPGLACRCGAGSCNACWVPGGPGNREAGSKKGRLGHLRLAPRQTKR